MTNNFSYKEIYIHKGKIYVFESDSFEPKEKFNKRSWFIIKYIEDNNLQNLSNHEVGEIIKKSRMWINEIYYGAIYIK